MAGDLISRAGGLTLSDLFDPSVNSDVPLFSRLLTLIGTAIFACIGGHRVVMAGLLDTFATIPPGGCLACLFAPHAAASHTGFLDSLLAAMLTLIAQSTLHICAARDMTSLLKPNPAAMAMFHGFPVWSEVVATQAIDTVRLDDVAEAEGATFLELDVQGAELMILQNAVERLRRAYVLHIEVEFLPLYEGQPLFSEIELFLRTQGYVLHRFTPMMSRVLKPLMLGKDIFAGMSQIVWSDAIFVRDFMRLERLSDEELLGVAQIVHDCYRSADLALRLLTEHDRRSGRNLARAYMFGLRHRAPREAAE